MGEAYVLPDSRVYLLVRVDDNIWEVWDGFRLKTAGEIRVSKIGEMTPNRVEINISHRANLQRTVLNSSAVVSLAR